MVRLWMSPRSFSLWILIWLLVDYKLAWPGSLHKFRRRHVFFAVRSHPSSLQLFQNSGKTILFYDTTPCLWWNQETWRLLCGGWLRLTRRGTWNWAWAHAKRWTHWSQFRSSNSVRVVSRKEKGNNILSEIYQDVSQTLGYVRSTYLELQRCWEFSWNVKSALFSILENQ